MSEYKNKGLYEKIWALAEPAEKYPKDWIVIPALDVIRLITKFQEKKK